MNIPFFSKGGRKSAKELLAAACNVYNYRRDVMDPADAARLKELIEKTESLFDDGKSGDPEYAETAGRLEALMRKVGGKVYPLSSISDNVDVVVVAGILALSVRSFFFQPFQIPTNSMYPSFYGMTPRVYAQGEEAPSFGKKLARLVTKKASNYELLAPEGGEVLVKLNSRGKGEIFDAQVRPSKWLFVLPSQEKAYTFSVNGREFELALPADFSLDSVMRAAYPLGEKADTDAEYMGQISRRGKIVERGDGYFLSLGNFEKGARILNFDILGGDMLFVDRFTYNFRRPKIGEPIVFRTGMCDGLTALNGGVPDDKYYIKRLVGEGSDTLRVEGSTLIRNGAPIEGSPAFEANAERAGEYSGYKAEGALKNGRTATVPEGSYYAMGDNSANSLDSRYWGGVPEKAVVGRALVIFYPFTERWGAAK